MKFPCISLSLGSKEIHLLPFLMKSYKWNYYKAEPKSIIVISTTCFVNIMQSPQLLNYEETKLENKKKNEKVQVKINIKCYQGDLRRHQIHKRTHWKSVEKEKVWLSQIVDWIQLKQRIESCNPEKGPSLILRDGAYHGKGSDTAEKLRVVQNGSEALISMQQKKERLDSGKYSLLVYLIHAFHVPPSLGRLLGTIVIQLFVSPICERLSPQDGGNGRRGARWSVSGLLGCALRRPF